MPYSTSRPISVLATMLECVLPDIEECGRMSLQRRPDGDWTLTIGSEEDPVSFFIWWPRSYVEPLIKVLEQRGFNRPIPDTERFICLIRRNP